MLHTLHYWSVAYENESNVILIKFSICFMFSTSYYNILSKGIKLLLNK
jgi:hypothetical protein